MAGVVGALRVRTARRRTGENKSNADAEEAPVEVGGLPAYRTLPALYTANIEANFAPVYIPSVTVGQNLALVQTASPGSILKAPRYLARLVTTPGTQH